MQLIENEDALQDALAFIDTFEVETTTSSNSGDADVSSGESPTPKSVPRRKKRPHTERIKSELEQLTRHAQALEIKLKRLKQQPKAQLGKDQLLVSWGPNAVPHYDVDSSSNLSVNRAGEPPTPWMDIAVEEFRLRRESEALNHQLRVTLAELIREVGTTDATMAPKLKDEDQNARINILEDQERELAKSLALRLRQLQTEVESVIKRTGLDQADSFLCWSQRKHDGNEGVIVESTYCLPVPFSFEQTYKAFATQTPCKSVSSIDKMKNGVDAYQLNWIDVVHAQQTYKLASKSSLRLITEQDRVIYVWTALVSLANKPWTFVEDSIVIVRRASTNSPSSLLQNWHRLWMEEKGCPSASDPLKECILRALNNRVREHMRSLKNSMMNSR